MRSRRPDHRRNGRRLALWLLVGIVGFLSALAAGCGSGDDVGTAASATSETTGAGDPPALIDLTDLEPCKDPRVPPQFRCGTIDVPFERSDPSLGTIPISFAVRPRSDRESPSKGAMIAIEGGPGYGSIGSARYYTATFGRLLQDRDLLLVDARGTGSSQPIDCRDMQSGRADDAIGLSECATKLGERFDSYRTAAIADDINDIRLALGYDEVDVYGDSYGTFLAQSYAFRHPEGMRALVLDSAYPVRGESPWYPSVWRTGIRGLGIACERSPDCDGDARARLDRFAAKLRREGINVGPFLDKLGSAGYSPPDSYLKLDRVVDAYLHGDTGPYDLLTKRGKAAYGKPSHYSVGQELTVSCNDYPMIWDKDSSEPQRRSELDAAIRAYPKDAFEPFTPREIALTSDVMYLECLTAPKPGPHYEPPAADDAEAPDVPVLVVAGELDNVTSPAEGRKVAEEFPNSKLFVWPDAGHVYSLYGADTRGAVKIRRFLRGNG